MSSPLIPPSAGFQEAFQRYALTSMFKQAHLEEVVNGRDWSLSLAVRDDPNYGRLGFGQEDFFDVQFLGTESSVDARWLWAWSDAQSSLPDDIRERSKELKRRLESWQQQESGVIPEIMEDQFSLNAFPMRGHSIVLMATGVMGAEAYYSGPIANGRVFMLIADKLPHRVPESNDDVVRLYRTLLQSLEVGLVANPKKQVDWFLVDDMDATIVDESEPQPSSREYEQGRKTVYQLPHGSRIEVEWDDQGRIGGLSIEALSFEQSEADE